MVALMHGDLCELPRKAIHVGLERELETQKVPLPDVLRRRLRNLRLFRYRERIPRTGALPQ